MSDQALTQAFTGRIFSLGDPEYVESTSNYFSAWENEIRPSYIYRPLSALELSQFIKSIRESALVGKLKLAIRGGGHTPWGGAANINSGVTIGLRRLEDIHVDYATKTASIGAGQRW